MNKRYVKLTEADRAALSIVWKEGSTRRERLRAHCLLLSDKGYDTVQLCEIFEINMTTLLDWLNRWESGRLAGLADKSGRGRKRLVSGADEKK